MGWASGNDIFDPVAQALIDAAAADKLKRDVLTKLIDALCNEGWDTEDESFDRFRHDPAIVQAFYLNDRANALGNYCDGRIGYDQVMGQWTVHCEYRDCTPHRWRSDNATIRAHNVLVRLWYDHERERHGGDGQVPGHKLMNETPWGGTDDEH